MRRKRGVVMEYKYMSSDPRFGDKEEMTIKEMILRYRTRGWDTLKDGTRMNVDGVMEDIFQHGVCCLD